MKLDSSLDQLEQFINIEFGALPIYTSLDYQPGSALHRNTSISQHIVEAATMGI
jgi:hypothetical protein